MTSSPLFISVEESTVIFGPIDQVGWTRASATSTAASSSGVRPRNGPPEAVSSRRATSPGPPARRHWWRAQCSESTGMISAPGVARACWTTGAPAMIDSLLARASRSPGFERGQRDREAGEAHHAVDDHVGQRWRWRPGPRCRSPARCPGAVAGPARAASAGSPRATTPGRSRRAWAASSSTERWAPMATTSNRSGQCSMTSMDWVPIDPVEPTRLTVTGDGVGPVGRAGHPSSLPEIQAIFRARTR